MGIDDTPTAAWRETDLEELCQEKRREQPRLEFKRELSLNSDAQKKEVEHDVQGLANSSGGHIIFGVAEKELPDGSRVAFSLEPLADGGVYERLNNLLDSRGEPRIPFDIHAIPALAGGIYIVVEVFGRRRPHMANDGRYYIRRNLLVRRMTEAEVVESYRDRFDRERGPTVPTSQTLEGSAPSLPAQRERVLHRGLTESELALFFAETGDPQPPGWMSLISYPIPLVQDLLDPRRYTTADFQTLDISGLWRSQETPLQYFSFEKTLDGFIGRLPPRDDTYPRYLFHFWPDGLLEYGDLLMPIILSAAPAENRVIPTHAVAEYVHDNLLAFDAIYRHTEYSDAIGVYIRLDNVRGYRLGVEPMRYIDWKPLNRDMIESTWQGPAQDLASASSSIARDISGRVFIAAGVQREAYFFDHEGNYTGNRPRA
jgi:hypothetical protein